jgi:hypothetical protein
VTGQLYFYFTLTLSSNLRRGFPSLLSSLFRPGSPTKLFYVFLFSFMCSTWRAHLLLDLITL